MLVAAAVVLSSSPPRIFVRSPTSLDSSPSLPSPSELFHFDSEKRSRFRPARKTRDSFSNDFKSTRTLLRTKKGAENVPIRSPGRERFKTSEPGTVSRSPHFILSKNSSRASTDVTRDGSSILLGEKPKDLPKQPPSKLCDAPQDQAATEEREVAPVRDANDATGSTSQVQALRAMPSRTDWTPPKDRDTSPAESSNDLTVDGVKSLPGNLFRNFCFDGNSTSDSRPQQSIAVSTESTKRQKIELVAGLAEASSSRTRMTETVTKKPIIKKRNKSPAKKSMTITGLATSHYFGQDDAQEDVPMMQYLSATQARRLDAEFNDSAGSNQIAKPSKQKQKSQKPQRRKSTLMSPQSAIKAVEAQEAVFGSASQLARDHQEAAMSSPRNDPVWTQQTQPISVESTTPRTSRGTSKFVKTRNLWGVAARDDDNALLHVDSVDLFDTPGVRVAFAGTDVLLEPNSICDNRHNLSQAGKHNIADVDDFDSPLLRNQPSKLGPPVSRSFHTSALARSPSRASKETKSQAQKELGTQVESETKAAPKPSKPAPKKPSYAGFTTHDLQKQLSSFGFKPVKKREKMIELLEKCWEENHRKEDPALKHGDFLTKVHDVSSRPQPKVIKSKKPAKGNSIEGETCPQKKPRKRAKGDKLDDEASPQKTTKRQKKTAQANEDQETPKKVRKKKSKSTVGSDPSVMDVDEVEFPRVGARGKKTAKANKSIRDITPPPSRPVQANADLGRSEVETSATNMQQGTIRGTATPPPSGVIPIGNKIHAAILRQLDDSAGADRNHQREPTWHEKILQYDPIILDDLTVWLNTQGLNLVDGDREVSPIEVRDWCETNSICCLWKGGWRGNKAKGMED